MRHNLGWLPSAIAVGALIGTILWWGDVVPTREGEARRAERAARSPTAPRAVGLRVLDADGRPVPEAAAYAWDDALSCANEPSGGRLVGRSDAGGRIRTEPLPLDAVIGVSHARAGVSGWASVAELPDASRMDADVRLTPAWICEGRVHWGDEAPVVGGLVTLAVAEGETFHPRLVGARVTDDLGGFAITIEAADRVDVTVLAEDVSTSPVTVESPWLDVPAARGRVNDALARRAVTVTLDADPVVTGRVTWPDGRPAGGVTVLLDRDATLVTDAEGGFAFSLRSAALGVHTICASTTGRFFVAGHLLDETRPMLQREAALFEQRPDDRRHAVTLELVETLALEGRVVSHCADAPADDLIVWAEPTLDELPRRAGLLTPHLEAATDASGRFRIEGAHPDVAYDLFVRRGRIMPYLAVGRGLRADAGTHLLTIVAGADSPPVVRGVLRDACDPTQIVGGASIAVFLMTYPSAMSSPVRRMNVVVGEGVLEDGSFALDLDALGARHSQRERVTLAFSAPGYTPAYLGPLDPVDLRAPLEIALTPRAEYEVTLVPGPGTSDDGEDSLGTLDLVGRTAGSPFSIKLLERYEMLGSWTTRLGKPATLASSVDFVQVWREGRSFGAAMPDDDPCDGLVSVTIPLAPEPDVDVWLRPVDEVGDPYPDPAGAFAIDLFGAGVTRSVPVAIDGLGATHVPPGLYTWSIGGGVKSNVLVPVGGGVIELVRR